MSKRATSAPLPPGFTYQPDFISPEEEASLIEEISRLEFHDVVMHGVAAKRRTIHCGWLYGYETWRLEPGPPPPDFLLPLRARCAAAAGVAPEALDETLVGEYPAGAGIGWHRSVQLAGCGCGAGRRAVPRSRSWRLRRGRSTFSTVRRGATGQHSIPPVSDLRYSITFRTLRGVAR